MERFVIQAVFAQAAGFEILDKNVGARGKFAHDLRAFRLRDIDSEGSLAAIGAQVIGGFAAGKRWAPGSCIVAALYPLNFDDVGAKVGEQLRSPRSSQDSREVEHLETGQRPAQAFLHHSPALDKAFTN